MKLWRQKYFESQDANDTKNIMFWEMVQMQYNEESIEKNGKIGMITTEEDTGVQEYRFDSEVKAFMLASTSDFLLNSKRSDDADIPRTSDEGRIELGTRGQSALSQERNDYEEEDMDDLM